MKRYHFGVLASCLSLLPACSSQHAPLLLQAVGPAPRVEAAPSDEGYLVVYSAWSPFTDYPSRVNHHSRYTLVSEDGKPNQEVKNYADRFDEGPVRLALPPGSYQVKAHAARFGNVIVPVIIQVHETTVVGLDGSPHSETAPASQTDSVTLPNGQVVGWSANSHLATTK